MHHQSQLSNAYLREFHATIGTVWLTDMSIRGYATLMQPVCNKSVSGKGRSNQRRTTIPSLTMIKAFSNAKQVTTTLLGPISP